MSTLFKNKLLLRYFRSKQSKERPLIGLSIKLNDYPDKIPEKGVLEHGKMERGRYSQKPLGSEVSIKTEIIHT